MNKLLILSIFILCFQKEIDCQIGGRYAYEFLNLPASARLTALGGYLIGVADEDINLAASNPVLLNKQMHNRISFSHNFHFSNIQNGYVVYGRHFEKWNVSTYFGVQYMDYGNFTYSDILGNQQGEFSVKETAFTLGASKKVADRLSLGTNIKGVFSNLEAYSSIGLLADIGLSYFKDSTDQMVSIVIKNIGYELTSYTGTRFGTPFDIQIGFSKKLKYLPFRFSIIAHQLHRSNIRYDDPNSNAVTDIFGEPVTQSKLSQSIDNVFRHLIFNGEFLLGKNQNLKLRAGYNHLRRKELSLTTFRSLAGFSLGLGLKIRSFKLDYGLGYYHSAGATNHITISTNLGDFFKKI